MGRRLSIYPLLAAVLCSMAAPAFAQSLLLRNGHLILGDGSERAGAILITDGVITAIGDDSLSVPAGATVIDLAGKTVMPALIDGHAHLGFQGSLSWGAENYNRDNLIDNLQRYAWYGFAAVFSAGSDDMALLQQLQAAQQAGEFIGARPLFAAGMAPPGQGPNNQFLEQVRLVESASGSPILYGIATPTEAIAAVENANARGARFIKLWVDDRGGTQQKLSTTLVQAVAGQAKGYGQRVFVHQQAAEDMPALLEAGVHGFLHGRLGPAFDAALAARTASVGAFIVPNLGLGELRSEAIGADAFLRVTSAPATRAPLLAGEGGRTATPVHDGRQEVELRESFQQLLTAGVDIVLGTDAGAVPNHPFGYTGHRELEIYVRLGMNPMQAIMAGTSTAARHLGLDDMGQLAPGFSADLLVLSANPLADIRNLRRIDSVYIRGRLLDRAALAQSWTGEAGN